MIGMLVWLGLLCFVIAMCIAAIMIAAEEEEEDEEEPEIDREALFRDDLPDREHWAGEP